MNDFVNGKHQVLLQMLHLRVSKPPNYIPSLNQMHYLSNKKIQFSVIFTHLINYKYSQSCYANCTTRKSHEASKIEQRKSIWCSSSNKYLNDQKCKSISIICGFRFSSLTLCLVWFSSAEDGKIFIYVESHSVFYPFLSHSVSMKSLFSIWRPQIQCRCLLVFVLFAVHFRLGIILSCLFTVRISISAINIYLLNFFSSLFTHFS